MASRTLGPRPGWLVGETIEAFEVDPAGNAVGGVADSATVDSDSTVTFTDVDSGKRYMAVDTNGIHVYFAILPDPDDGGGGVSQEEVDTSISTHNDDTTSVHGISDTSVLATATDVGTAVSNHNDDETAVHGISDTAFLPAVIQFNVTWPARPTGFPMVFWVGGDASDDDPSADMEVGDVWFPHSA